jgi:cell division protein FtsL
MVQTMSSRADYAQTPRRARGDDQATFLSRWLKVWVILLTVVVLVVVGYLIVITNSLANINGNLATANAAVSGAGSNVTDLPSQVSRINGSLAGIDPALKPIPGQANDIIGALTSIRDKLADTDSSLKNTSSVLQTVLGTARSISGVLIAADRNGNCGGGTPCGPNQLGVQNIHERVDNANRVLIPAESDARNINTRLTSINGSLTGICASPLAPILTAGACPR